MKIFDLVENFEDDLKEYRKNNFGREISNQQGQNLGKKLAAGDPNAQADLAAAKSARATNKTDAGGDTLGQTTPQQRLAAKKANSSPVKLPDKQPRDDTNFRNKPLPDAPEGEPAPSGDATPGVGNAQGDNNAANTNVKPEKKPTDWKKLAGGIKNATVGALSGVGDIASAGMDAAGRTLGSAKAGYAYGRHGELPAGHRDAQGNAITPGQRTGTLRTSSDQAQAPQGQDGGAQGQSQGGGALSNFAQNGLFGGNKQGGGQQGGGGAAPVNFNAVMKAIPSFTPKQKAAIGKLVSGATPQVQQPEKQAMPKPEVVDGGKASQQAVAEGFHSKFLGMMI